MDRLYALDHAPIPFYFRQSNRDFVVDEIPLYPWSGEGEHLVLHVRKKDLATWDMVGIIADHLGIKHRDIGYAGLKDKNALTKQYISLPRTLEPKLENFEHEKIKILDRFYHDNKIRMGHLKGNRFFIRLKKVTPTAAAMIDQALKTIAEQGMPNYFGFQRFGLERDNARKGEEIVLKKRRERNIKMRRMYVNAYQSHLFNLWLSRRIEISRMVKNFSPSELVPLLNMPQDLLEQMKAQPHAFKLLEGDIMMHYPYGKLFEFDGSAEEMERFTCKDISPTGLLSGKRCKTAQGQAHLIEKEFSVAIDEDGARRYAWIFPEAVDFEYKPQEAWYEMHFTLPKGSYATVLIEEIAKRNIKEDENE